MSKRSFFETPVEYLKGVGPKRGDILKKELGIFTFNDLLNYFPFRYIDRSRFYHINDVADDNTYIQVKGRITFLKTAGKGRHTRLIAELKDETGVIDLVWFKGIKWVMNSLVTGKDYVVFGKPALYKGRFNIPHPEMELLSESGQFRVMKFQPVYHSTEKCRAKGLDSRGICKLQQSLIPQLPSYMDETLPEDILDSLKLIGIRDAYVNVHLPEDPTALRNAQFRLKFEELFYIQLDLLIKKLIRTHKVKGKVITHVGDSFNDFYESRLPFELTGAQKRVIKEIRKDLGSGHQMNRLVQGDVGSGKTLVALMSMLLVHDNGYQAVLMAPTEILAQQHFATISKLLEGSGVTVDLLTGSVKGEKRKQILEDLGSGELNFIIGTHALIEDPVKLKDPGLVVIDEQHRFGVAQRAKLWARESDSPHVLIMTATPIPRTLAMTLYGDLDTSVIDELPPGRKPVKTLHRFERSRLQVIKFLKQEISKGRQVYVVYPLIEESEKLDYMNLQQGYEGICNDFPRPQYHTSIVHGRMKARDKEREMNMFISGRTHIMVATTVIEVGVDVPNASVMVIESAERFGLSQLHQLRGRVGRGADQSYCILMTGQKLSADSKLRMETMVRTSDGFEIAETDLRLRGPGDMAGTQQSGQLDLKIADLTRDGRILETARKAAISILESDPELEHPENEVVASQRRSRSGSKLDWSRVS